MRAGINGTGRTRDLTPQPIYCTRVHSPEAAIPMPIISKFNGISIRMYFFDDRRHAAPHVHAEYSEFRAAVNILTGETLSGCLPPRQTRLLQKWIQLRQTELLNDWTLAVAGRPLQPIEPLDA